MLVGIKLPLTRLLLEELFCLDGGMFRLCLRLANLEAASGARLLIWANQSRSAAPRKRSESCRHN
jgi:hypothetical protein